MNVSISELPSIFLVAFLCVTNVIAEPDLRLVDAVKSSSIETVKLLIEEKINVNTTQPDGSSAIAWAAYLDDLETADILIRSGADPNIANAYGITPLFLACSNGSFTMVKKLLDARTNPDVAQWMGVTPLMVCSRSGSLDAVKLLLAHGANVNAKDIRRGQTSLMWAAARQHLEVARVLTEYGAEINRKTHVPSGFEQRKFITYGIHRRDPTGPDKIGEEDFHPNSTSSRGGFTALMFAAKQGDVEMAKMLMAAGADINSHSLEYGSALVIASANGYGPLALFLLDEEADPDIKDRWGFTALHYSLQEGITAIGMSRARIPSDQKWLKRNIPEVVESLLRHGADPNMRVGDGFPPFSTPRFARTTGNAMPELRQPGATPFLLASASFDISLMRLLVSHGADPLLTTYEHTTPLMVAAGMGRQEDLTNEEEILALEATKLAWELGNNVNAFNQDGRSALAAAAYIGANKLIKFLVDKGADLERKDRYGQTPLSIAKGIPYKIQGGDKRFRRPPMHSSSVKLLLSLGAQSLD